MKQRMRIQRGERNITYTAAWETLAKWWNYCFWLWETLQAFYHLIFIVPLQGGYQFQFSHFADGDLKLVEIEWQI